MPVCFKASPQDFDAAQRLFDFLMPFKNKHLLTTSEVAKVIGREVDFVRALIEEGRLEAHADSALGDRLSNRVTRRSVVVYLMRTANYDPEHFFDSFKEAAINFPATSLDRLIALLTSLRKSKL